MGVEKCTEAARILGAKSLRDVELKDVQSAEDKLGPLLFKEAIRRYRKCAYARGRRGASKQPCRYFGQVYGRIAHRSLDQDFEVTVPAMNVLVDLIEPVIHGVGGVRMTGGGFGGCVVCIAPKNRVERIRAAVEDATQPKLVSLLTSTFAQRLWCMGAGYQLAFGERPHRIEGTDVHCQPMSYHRPPPWT